MSNLIGIILASGLLLYLVKSTAVLTGALVLTRLMRTSAASSRELIWRLAFAGVVALPLLALVVPRLGVQVVTPSVVHGSRSSAAAGGSLTLIDAGATPSNAHVAAPSTVRPKSAAPASRTTRPGVDWSLGLGLLWALGALLSLRPLVLGVLAARRAVAGSISASGSGWGRDLRAVEEATGVRSAVDLRVLAGARVPFVWQALPWARPVLVVPELDEMPRASWRRAALSHELAHVVRRDGPTQLAARLVACTLWPIPLAWIALRELRLEAERASDDAVLGAGHAATEYAEQLVGLAAIDDGAASLPVVAMAGSRDFPRRLIALLDERMSHVPRSSLRARLAASVVLAGLLPVAALGAQEQEAVAVDATPSSAYEKARSRGLAALAALQDAKTGAWHGNVGYKLNNSWIITGKNQPHVGATALALEAFAEAGQDRGRHAQTVEAGRRFLLQNQTVEGFISANGTRMREHALATLALARLAANRQDAPRLDALESAVDFTLRHQNRLGGWRFVPGAQEADVLETAYQLRALLAAREAGVTIPDTSLVRALAYIERTRVAEQPSEVFGGYRFQDLPTARVTANTTAAGLYALAHSEAAVVADLETTAELLLRLDAERAAALPEHFLTWDADYLSYFAFAAVRARESVALRATSAFWSTPTRMRMVRTQSSGGTWDCAEGTGDAWATAIACLVLGAD